MATKKTPAWIWIGCGCLVAIIGLAVVLGGLGFAGAKLFQGMVEDMADPVARTAAALDTLGAETLPDGWNTHAFFHIPFAMTLVILSDGEPPPAFEGDFGDKVESLESLEIRPETLGRNMFIYAAIRGRDKGEGPSIDLVLSGERSGGAQVNLGSDFDIAEDLDEGSLRVGDQDITWASHHGKLRTDRGAITGVWSNLAVDCPDGSFREALWFQRTDEDTTELESTAAAATEAEGTAPIPAEVADGSPRDWAGTPADPKAIEVVMGHFDFCG